LIKKNFETKKMCDDSPRKARTMEVMDTGWGRHGAYVILRLDPGLPYDPRTKGMPHTKVAVATMTRADCTSCRVPYIVVCDIAENGEPDFSTQYTHGIDSISAKPSVKELLMYMENDYGYQEYINHERIRSDLENEIANLSDDDLKRVLEAVRIVKTFISIAGSDSDVDDEVPAVHDLTGHLYKTANN
jgi:hypothetical protein